MSTKAIAEISEDAGILISEISKKQKGDIVTYADMQNWISWDVRNNRGVMVTVKNRLLRDYGIVLGVVFNEGYKLLDDKEVVGGELSRDRERRRRSAVRSKRKAGVVDLSKLDEQERLKCLGEITAAHITIQASADRSVKRIECQLNGSAQPLALNKALEAIKNNISGPKPQSA